VSPEISLAPHLTRSQQSAERFPRIRRASRNSPARFYEKFQCDGSHCPADSAFPPNLPSGPPTRISTSPSATAGNVHRAPCLPPLVSFALREERTPCQASPAQPGNTIFF
jgi:hypothetical protein